MTIRLFEEDVYQRIFTAQVTGCEPFKDGFEVTLNQTAFYPEGGGQPGDSGWLGNSAVLDTHERDGEIYHYVTESVIVGRQLTGTIDWQQRFSNMQHHSGEHILSGVIHARFGYDNIGFHMGQEAVTIDISGLLSETELKEIEQQVNQLIQMNIPVTESYPDEETLKAMDYRSKKTLTGRVRIITIEQGDVCACCGTHVARTGEIGLLKITGAIHYKGGMRITMLCGNRALEDYRRKQNSVIKISNLLSVKQESVIAGVEKLKAEASAKEFLIGQLYQRILAEKLSHYQEQQERIFLVEEQLSSNQLRIYTEAFKEKGNIVLICSGDSENGYRYALGSKEADMRAYSKKLNQALNGRGGGSSGLVQGTLYASVEAIQQYFLGEKG